MYKKESKEHLEEHFELFVISPDVFFFARSFFSFKKNNEISKNKRTIELPPTTPRPLYHPFHQANTSEDNETMADPLYDLIMDKQLARNEYPMEKLDTARANMHTSLMAAAATKEIWDKYKDKVSSGPAHWTMARAINTGVSYPHSFVGCHAGDAESWDDFQDFFYPVIEAYHTNFLVSEGEAILSQLGTPSERMDPAKIHVDLSPSAQKKIISTRIRIARNISSFPLNPGGSVESRQQELLRKVYDGFESDELKGDLFEHATMSDEQRQGLIDDHFLFRGADAMQAASGYHVGWPHGRGVFHNKEKTFVNWINEGDHIRIISMKLGADIRGVFQLLSDGANAIEAGIKNITGLDNAYLMHRKFGAITCCPSNLGTGLRCSVHILIPKLIQSWGFQKIDDFCRERFCQARGSSGEHSEVIDRVGISNWRRIGIPEYSLIEDMIKCVNDIVQTLEDAINSSITCMCTVVAPMHIILIFQSFKF